MSWKPFVVGVDASPEAASAAAFAHRTAERVGVGYRLVHATPDVLGPFDLWEGATYLRAVAAHARSQVAVALGGKVSSQVLDEMIVRLGSPAVVLKQAVAQVDAEFVVLGGKHHSTLGRWLGGSTSLNVARTTEVPVLVTAGTPTVIRRVLVAVDLSGAARPTLAAAERYAALFGAELRALSVFEPLPAIPEVGPAYDTTQYYAMSEEFLTRDIWPAIRTKGVEKIVRYGTAVDTILREATDWKADLLVVGSHGKGWAARVLVGSVTERLLNHLPTSLIVVPVSAAQVAEPAEVTLATAMA